MSRRNQEIALACMAALDAVTKLENVVALGWESLSFEGRQTLAECMDGVREVADELKEQEGGAGCM